MEAEVHEKLGEYKQFVREVEGEEPTNGAICSAALEMLFEADKSFARSREGKRKNSRNNAAANSPSAASATSTN